MQERFAGPRSGADRAGAIVVAAGLGRRMGGVDKVFALVAGRPLLAWSVEAFERSSQVDVVVVVLGPHNVAQGRLLAEQRRWRKVSAICVGGDRRQDSVRLGLGQLPPCSWVLVHDGARPCLTGDIIARGVEAARATGAAVAAMPAKDTVKVVSPEGMVTATPDRKTLWAVQTPQVFRRDLLEEVHRRVRDDVTDDAAMAERLGYSVRVFEGSYSNIKVTTPEDLRVAEVLLTALERAQK